MLLADATIVTAGVNNGLTTIITLLLVALAAVTHVALLVIMQVTSSPLASVLVVKVGLLAPALLPFTCH